MTTTEKPQPPKGLRYVCAEADHWRAWMTEPFAFELAGEPMAVATNGMAMLAIPGDYAVAEFPGGVKPEIVSGLLARTPSARAQRTTLGALRTFCGQAPTPEPDTEPACATCDSTGVIECEECDGSGEIECECDCGHEHEAPCKRCRGIGETYCRACPRGEIARLSGPVKRPERQPDRAWIGRALINRDVLRAVLAGAPAGGEDVVTVDTHGPTDAVTLVAAGWRGAVMPLRSQGGETEREAPRFDVAGAA